MDLDQLASFGLSATHCTAPTTKSMAVGPSRELDRILAVPRQLTDPSRKEDVDRLVKKSYGQMELRPVQVSALWAARAARGLFAPIAVGGGKTLIACLLPTILEIPDAMILTTAGLVAQARKMLAEYYAHFKIHQTVQWVSYGILSNANHCLILDQRKPKLIIADECHFLSNPKAARTKRFMRYFKEHPETIFCGLTGTITKSSIRDYAHLQHLALRDRTPLPREFPILSDWADALDVSNNVRPPGALLQLCTDEERAEISFGRLDPTSAARRGVQRRMRQTAGIVASTTNELPGVELEIRKVTQPHSQYIEDAYRQLDKTWERPDGEVLTYSIEFARVAKQVRLGGYYYWAWPHNEPDVEWVAARRAYRAEMRQYLGHSSRPGLDSPILVENAIRRGDVLFESWTAWEAVRSRPEPPTRWKWISDRMVRWAVAWLADQAPSIVWTDVSVIGRKVAQIAGLPWYGAGEEAARGILAEEGSRSIVASIGAHGQGRNLQPFRRNLVLTALSTGKIWEQLIGRTHRPGQRASKVTIDVPRCFEGELDKALEQARFIEETTGNEQKLLSVEILDVP